MRLTVINSQTYNSKTVINSQTYFPNKTTTTVKKKQFTKNKYRLLGDDKTAFAGNRSVISHTVEISTLGLTSDTKVFTAATN